MPPRLGNTFTLTLKLSEKIFLAQLIIRDYRPLKHNRLECHASILVNMKINFFLIEQSVLNVNHT